MARQQSKPPKRVMTRRYRSRGVDVEIREARNRIDLKLDGKPIRVSMIDGKVHCQLAHAFRTFASVDEVVDTLLANQGRTWTLHGHVCDERCGEGGHHHDDPHAHGPGPGHRHGGKGGAK